MAQDSHSIEFSITCKVCHGKGYYGFTESNTCKVCLGLGSIILSGKEIDYQPCKPCNGKGYYGYTESNTCKVCKGTGLIPLGAAIKIIPASQPHNAPPPFLPKSAIVKNKVFIVHGQNLSVRDAIDLYLTKELKIPTVVMQAGHFGGRTLPEKFEELASTCSFAIFILTADDILHDQSNNKHLKRARQNVVLEVGYFWGALGRRNKVAFLVDQDPQMELPSDIQGVGWIPITPDLAETKMKLRKELEAVQLVPNV
jgi:predicted nucleotide-binding protein